MLWQYHGVKCGLTERDISRIQAPEMRFIRTVTDCER